MPYARDTPFWERPPVPVPELNVGLKKIPFAPTPLNPHELTVESDPYKAPKPYIPLAFEQLCETFDENLARMGDGQPSQPVKTLVAELVTSSFFRRIEKNDRKCIPDDSNQDTRTLFQKACIGEATPTELLELLQLAPENLTSLELAEQSHPFDWGAEEMNGAVEAAMLARKFTMFSPDEQNPRYFFMRASEPTRPDAVAIVREADRGFVAYDENDGAAVVQRDTFVIDLSRPGMESLYEEMVIWEACFNSDKQMRGGHGVPYPDEEIAAFIERQLAVGVKERSPALCPVARSYFAYDIAGQVGRSAAKEKQKELARQTVTTARTSYA